MDDPGYSIWVILLLVALLFAVLWGGMAFFIAFGGWFITRTGGLREDRPPRQREAWEAPPPPQDPPQEPR